MAQLGDVIDSADGYTLRACTSFGTPGFVVVRDSDGCVISRTYRSEADASLGWLGFRIAGNDAAPGGGRWSSFRRLRRWEPRGR